MRLGTSKSTNKNDSANQHASSEDRKNGCVSMFLVNSSESKK
jgi:hypothetical protein